MATNQRSVIDNATLSGVERLLGTSQVKNHNYIDNDIVCFEKLVTAILFSDSLYAIDDYKKEYRSQRLRKFDFIEFKKLDDATYADFSNRAGRFAHSMTFGLENAKPAGDVVAFFESLRLHPQFRWNAFVSSEYLTLTYLVDSKYDKAHERATDTFFRSEITDSDLVSSDTNYQPNFVVPGRSDIQSVKDLVRAFADRNPRFVSEDGKSALSRASFGYGWAAERSYFYNAFAALENANVYLAPLRDAFCESCCRLDYPSQTVGLLSGLKENTQQALATILTPSGHAQFAMKLPFFTSYLISQVESPQEAIELAHELSARKEFQDCRTILHNLSHLSTGERTAELNQIFKYLEQSCEKLMKKYAVSTSNGLQYSASLGLAGPSISIGGKLGGLLRPFRNRPFARVFRNIAQEMLNVEGMGALHEKLCSSIRYHEEKLFSDVSTTPRFMEERENEYGRPAKL